jgi:superfamily II DNA or RNA helicase
MALRRPQRESFDKIHEMFRFLDGDLPGVGREDFLHKLKELHSRWTFATDYPSFTVALATGVGKTRLMGAVCAYLYLAKQSSNFVLLASRAAILRKLEEEAFPGSSKYLFVDTSLVPAPRVCFRGNIESFDFEDAAKTEAPNLFIFSPQGFVGDDKRVSRPSEFTGSSVVEFMRSRKDLVVFVDEAHHLGGMGDQDTKAWTEAVRGLTPRVQVGLTATPRSERGANLLYSYDLPTCLREKLYTKGVRVIVRQHSSEFDDDDWDHHTLDFALDRLSRKSAALTEFRGTTQFPPIKPVLLVCAEDTKHADRVAAWLKSDRGLAEDEVLVTHSEKKKSEEDLARLVGIEQPGSRVRVVVNVYELTEGWDVTNVFVIAPLRRMGTFQGAVQTMGRGLRLPAGRRVDDPELDTLDVLCFGKESLEEVLKLALKDFGDEDDAESSVSVTEADSPELERATPTIAVDVPLKTPTTLSLPTVRRVPVEPDLEFAPGALREISHIPAAEFELTDGAVAGTAEGLKYPRPVFTRLSAGRVMAGLGYLSEPLHRQAVESLVERFLDHRGVVPDASVELDWMKVAEFLKDQIDRPYRKKDVQFTVEDGAVSVKFEAFKWKTVEGEELPLDQRKLESWSPTLCRRLIGAWRKCIHEAVAFESGGEFGIARILDSAASVAWWARNDPPRVRIPTPIGYYEPDVVVALNSKPAQYILLECKRADFWKPPESDSRVKARAADAWCEAAKGAAHQWDHWVVLDADVSDCKVIDDLYRVRANA